MKSLTFLLLLLLPTSLLAASKDRFVTSTGTQLVRVTSADNVETLSNSSGAVSVGDAVYLSAANTVAKASAATTGQPVYGLVYEVVNATTCVVITRGIFPSWSTSLTPGQVYYLAETAGALQTTPVLGTSKLAQLVGTAVSSTDLWVDPVNMSAIGTSAGKILTLDYQGKLPAVDGSQLTGVGGSTSYSPATGAHWTDPDPTTVGGGLDALAARVVSAEAVTGDAELAALAGTTSAENSLPYFTGAGTASTTTLTSTARGLLDDATAGDMRTTLGLGSAATLTAGTSANNAVQLDGTGKLPAVDGSALTSVSAAAGDVSYTPGTGADWSDPDPTTTSGALDALASRVVAAEAEYAPALTVCPSGCAYSSVQAAVTAAASSSPTDGQSAVVEVYPGTYVENVTLSAHIALVGMGGPGHNFPVISGKVTADYGTTAGPYNVAASLSRLRISSPAGDYGLDFTGSGAQALHLHDVAVYMGATGKGIRVNNSGTQGGFTSIVYADDLIVHGSGANANAGMEVSAGRVNLTGPARLYSPVYAPVLTISGTGLVWQTGGTLAVDGSITHSSSGSSSLISVSGTVASGAIISQSAGTLLLGQVGGYSATPSQAAVVSRSGGTCIYSLGSIAGVNYLAPTTGGCSAQTSNGLYAAFQGFDSELSALASTTSQADALPYFTGAGTAATTTLTSTARGLLDDATAGDMRTTLGLGTAATASTGTAAGNVVLLDSQARLPAVDGSLLTGISGGSPYAADSWDAVWEAADGTTGWSTSGTWATNGIATTAGKSSYTVITASSNSAYAYRTLASTAPDSSFEMRANVYLGTMAASSDPNSWVMFCAFGRLHRFILSANGPALYTSTGGASPVGAAGVPTAEWLTFTMRATSPDTGNTAPTAAAVTVQLWVGEVYVGASNSSVVTTCNGTAFEAAGAFTVGTTTGVLTAAVAWVAYRTGHNDAPPSYTYKGLGYAPDVTAP